MANTIKLKRGSGSDPGASDLSVGELAIRTDSGKIFTKKDDGTVAEISGDGGFDATANPIKIGPNAGSHNAGSSTVNVGSAAGYSNAGSDSVNIGDNAGYSNAGSNSINIGKQAGYSNAGSNTVNIGNSSITKFSVPGINFTVKDTTATEDYVLTVDSSGEAGWEALPTIPTNNNQLTNGASYITSSGTSAACSGNAATATALATARTIAGVSFDGSANISLNNNAITNGASYVTSSIINSLNASNLDSGTVGAARLSTATTQSAGDNSTKIATTAYTDTAISNLVDSSPSALNTLNELAAALGDDANFSTTVTNSLATKLPLAGGTMTGTLNISSSNKLRLGDSAEIQINHLGGNSFIEHTLSTGNLFIQADSLRLTNTNRDETFIACNDDGNVEIYHNNSLKFETTSTGATVTGTLTATAFSGDGSGLTGVSGTTINNNANNRIITGSDTANTLEAESSLTWNGSELESSAAMLLKPAGNLTLETSGSSRMFMTIGGRVDITTGGRWAMDCTDRFTVESASRVNLTAPNIYSYAGTHHWFDNSGSGEYILKGISNAAVELYFDNSKKFETAGGGVNIVGDAYFLTDNGSAYFGASNDLRIFHDGSNSYIKDQGTGNLKIDGSDNVELQAGGSTKAYTYANGLFVYNQQIPDNGELNIGNGSDLKLWHDGSNSYIKNSTNALTALTGGFYINNVANSESMAAFNANSHCSLYYDNSKKFETASYGAQVYGNLVVGTDAGELLFTNPDGHSPKFKEAIGGIECYTNNTKRWTIEENGNTVYQDDVKIFFGGGNDFRLWHDGSDNYIYGTGNHALIFGANNSEKLRLAADGEFRVQGGGTDVANRYFKFSVHSTSPHLAFNHNAVNNNHSYAIFYAAASQHGEIKQSGSGVSYHSNSDYRLKENIIDLTDGIARVKQLKPRRFEWKVDSTNTLVDGFIAHEVASVVPEIVSGIKDEVVTNENKANLPKLENSNIGDPVYQTMSQEGLVPLLTAALQEAISKIETLETKVAALESS